MNSCGTGKSEQAFQILNQAIEDAINANLKPKDFFKRLVDSNLWFKGNEISTKEDINQIIESFETVRDNSEIYEFTYSPAKVKKFLGSYRKYMDGLSSKNAEEVISDFLLKNTNYTAEKVTNQEVLQIEIAPDASGSTESNVESKRRREFLLTGSSIIPYKTDQISKWLFNGYGAPHLKFLQDFRRELFDLVYVDFKKGEVVTDRENGRNYINEKVENYLTEKAWGLLEKNGVEFRYDEPLPELRKKLRKLSDKYAGYDNNGNGDYLNRLVGSNDKNDRDTFNEFMDYYKVMSFDDFIKTYDALKGIVIKDPVDSEYKRNNKSKIRQGANFEDNATNYMEEGLPLFKSFIESTPLLIGDNAVDNLNYVTTLFALKKVKNHPKYKRENPVKEISEILKELSENQDVSPSYYRHIYKSLYERFFNPEWNKDIRDLEGDSFFSLNFIVNQENEYGDIKARNEAQDIFNSIVTSINSSNELHYGHSEMQNQVFKLNLPRTEKNSASRSLLGDTMNEFIVENSRKMFDPSSKLSPNAKKPISSYERFKNTQKLAVHVFTENQGNYKRGDVLIRNYSNITRDVMKINIKSLDSVVDTYASNDRINIDDVNTQAEVSEQSLWQALEALTGHTMSADTKAVYNEIFSEENSGLIRQQVLAQMVAKAAIQSRMQQFTNTYNDLVEADTSEEDLQAYLLQNKPEFDSYADFLKREYSSTIDTFSPNMGMLASLGVKSIADTIDTIQSINAKATRTNISKNENARMSIHGVMGDFKPHISRLNGKIQQMMEMVPEDFPVVSAMQANPFLLNPDMFELSFKEEGLLAIGEAKEHQNMAYSEVIKNKIMVNYLQSLHETGGRQVVLTPMVYADSSAEYNLLINLDSINAANPEDGRLYTRPGMKKAFTTKLPEDKGYFSPEAIDLMREKHYHSVGAYYDNLEKVIIEDYRRLFGENIESFEDIRTTLSGMSEQELLSKVMEYNNNREPGSRFLSFYENIHYKNEKGELGMNKELLNSMDIYKNKKNYMDYMEGKDGQLNKFVDKLLEHGVDIIKDSYMPKIPGFEVSEDFKVRKNQYYIRTPDGRINPVIKRYFYDWNFVSENFTHLNTGSTEQFGKGEAASFLQQTKRNNIMTSTFYPYQLGLPNGVPTHSNIAIFYDPEMELNTAVASGTQEIYDGSSLSNELSMIKKQNSLGGLLGQQGGIHHKSTGHDIDPRTGTFTYQKHADHQMMTTEMMRMSSDIKTMFKKQMTAVQINFVPNEEQLEQTTKVRRGGKIVNLSLQEGKTYNNFYEIFEDLGGTETLIETTKEEGQFTVDGKHYRYTKVGDPGHVSNVMVNLEAIGYKEPKGSRNTPSANIKDQYIETFTFKTSIKNGVSNINPSDTLMDDSVPVNYSQISNINKGLQLNATKDTDNKESTAPTQIISAVSFRGKTQQEAFEVYNALKELTVRKLKEDLEQINSTDPKENQKFLDFVKKKLESDIQARDTISLANQIIKDADPAYDNAQIFGILTSSLNSYFTDKGIRENFSGLQYVLSPSLVKIYDVPVRNDDGTLARRADGTMITKKVTEDGFQNDGMEWVMQRRSDLHRNRYYLVEGEDMPRYLTTKQELDNLYSLMQEGKKVQRLYEPRRLEPPTFYWQALVDGEIQEFSLYDLPQTKRMLEISKLKGSPEYTQEMDREFRTLKKEQQEIIESIKKGENYRFGDKVHQIRLDSEGNPMFESTPAEVIIGNNQQKIFGIKDNTRLSDIDQEYFSQYVKDSFKDVSKTINNRRVRESVEKITESLRTEEGAVFTEQGYSHHNPKHFGRRMALLDQVNHRLADNEGRVKFYPTSEATYRQYLESVQQMLENRMRNLYDKGESSTQIEKVRKRKDEVVKILEDPKKFEDALNTANQEKYGLSKEPSDNPAIIALLEASENLRTKSAPAMYKSWQMSRKGISIRIPSQDLPSAMSAEAVAYTYSMKNTIMMPYEVMLLQGADLDIDKENWLQYYLNENGEIEGWNKDFDITDPKSMDLPLDETASEKGIKNYIMQRMFKVFEDPVNIQGRENPIATDSIKKEASKTLKAEAEKDFSRNNPADRDIVKVNNQIGNQVIGIAATGIKSHSSNVFVYNETLRNINTLINAGVDTSKTKGRQNYQEVLKLIDRIAVPEFGQEGRRLLTDINIDLIQDENKILFFTLLANNKNPLSQEQVDTLVDKIKTEESGVDILGEILNAATDNAKDPNLYKINAGIGEASVYVALSTQGVPFNEIVRLMTSPAAEYVLGATKRDLFSPRKKVPYRGTLLYKLEKALNKYTPEIFKNEITGTNAYKAYVEALENNEDAVYPTDIKTSIAHQLVWNAFKQKQIQEKRVTRQTRPEKANVTQEMIDEIKEDIIKLKEAFKRGSEIKTLGQSLGINQGNPSSTIYQAYLYKKRMEDEVNRVLERKVNDKEITEEDAEKEAEETYVNEEGHEETNAVANISEVDEPFMLEKFITDEAYAERMIDKYNQKKYGVNILNTLKNTPHFNEYLKVFQAHQATMRKLTYKTENFEEFVDSMVRLDFFKKGKRPNEIQAKKILSFMDDLLINKYFNEKGPVIKLPEGQTFRLRGKKDIAGYTGEVTQFNLATPEGRHAFVSWVHSSFIPNARIDQRPNLRGNFLLTNLRLDNPDFSTKDLDSKTYWRVGIDTSEMKSDKQQVILDELSKAMADLKGVDFTGGLSYYDILRMYNLMAHRDTMGKYSFTGFLDFKDFNKDEQSLSKDFLQFQKSPETRTYLRNLLADPDKRKSLLTFMGLKYNLSPIYTSRTKENKGDSPVYGVVTYKNRKAVIQQFITGDVPVELKMDFIDTDFVDSETGDIELPLRTKEPEKGQKTIEANDSLNKQILEIAEAESSISEKEAKKLEEINQVQEETGIVPDMENLPKKVKTYIKKIEKADTAFLQKEASILEGNTDLDVDDYVENTMRLSGKEADRLKDKMKKKLDLQKQFLFWTNKELEKRDTRTTPAKDDSKASKDLEGKAKASNIKLLNSIANRLRSLNPELKVELVNDNQMRELGFPLDRARVKGDTIYLNTDRASVGDAIHEMGHIAIELLKTENPGLYSQIIEAMKQHPVYKTIQKEYKELQDENDIAEEAFSHLLGVSFDKRNTYGASQGWFGRFGSLWDSAIKAIKSGWSRLMGKEPTVMDALDDMSFMNMTVEQIIERFGDEVLQKPLRPTDTSSGAQALRDMGVSLINRTSEELRLMKAIANRMVC